MAQQRQTQSDDSWGWIILLVIVGVILWWYCATYGCFGIVAPPPTPTPPPTSTNTPVPTRTPSPTATRPPSGERPLSAYPYLELILDTSGSMGRETFRDSGRTKMEAAKDRLSEHLRRQPQKINRGLRIFGRPGRPACNTELLVPIELDNASEIAEAMQDLEPEGWTPLAEAIREAGDDFSSLKEGAMRTIWVISDGKQEGCEALNPCDVVRELKDLGIRFVMDVIGLDVDEVTEEQLRCIAWEGDGIYIPVRSEDELDDALYRVFEHMDQIPPATESYSSDSLGFSVFYPEGWEVREGDDKVQFAKPHGDMEITVRVRGAEGDVASELSQRLDELSVEYPDLNHRSYPVSGFIPWEWDVKAADAYFTRHNIPHRALIVAIIPDSKVYSIEISGNERTVRLFLESATFLQMISSIQVW